MGVKRFAYRGTVEWYETREISPMAQQNQWCHYEEVSDLERELLESRQRNAQAINDCARANSKAMLLERELAEKDKRIGELVRALGEVHRLAHDRPTKDILPIIHAITEPWHIHHDAALESKSTSLIYKIYGNRDRAALADVKKKPCPTTE